MRQVTPKTGCLHRRILPGKAARDIMTTKSSQRDLLQPMGKLRKAGSLFFLLKKTSLSRLGRVRVLFDNGAIIWNAVGRSRSDRSTWRRGYDQSARYFLGFNTQLDSVVQLPDLFLFPRKQSFLLRHLHPYDPCVTKFGNLLVELICEHFIGLFEA